MMNDRIIQLLLITQEECAEVTQSISKILRFGLDSVHLDKSNRQRLTEEVGDLCCMIDLMIENDLIQKQDVEEYKMLKRKKLKKWSNIFRED